MTDLSRRELLERGGGIVMLLSLGGMVSGCGEEKAAPTPLPDHLADTPALESWVRIQADGRVSLFTGKAELGQGILTALVQIASEELDVAPGRIDITSADTTLTPDEGITNGSLSIQQSGMAIRQAAAELRALLIERAAGRMGVRADRLRVGDGLIEGGGKSLSYWALAESDPFTATASGRARPKTPDARQRSGDGLERIDIPDKVFGRARFLQDIRIDGMLHARVVRPPSLSAILVGSDGDAVKAMPGVIEVVRDGRFLAVVAEREEQAIKAAEALAAATLWRDAQRLPDQKTLIDFILQHPGAKRSDITPDSMAASAADGPGKRVSARYFRPFQAHASLAPSVGLAQIEDGVLIVHSHCQGVFALRQAIAETLSMDIEAVRVIHKEGAGCYGMNAADDAGLDAAIISHRLGGRPVRVQYMRSDEFLWEPYGSAMVMAASARIDPEGRISDWRYDVHGFPHSSRPGAGRAGNLIGARLIAEAQPRPPATNIPMPNGGLERNAVPLYDFASGALSENFIADSPLRVGSLRGLGAYANVFAVESFLDELAHAGGTDPVALRLAHLSDPRARAVIEAAASAAGWGAPLASGKGRGIAFSRYKNRGGYLAVVVRLDADRDSGQLMLKRAVAAVDCGEIVNPDGVRNQVEGGLIQSASWTLKEAVAFDQDGIRSRDWLSYPILTFEEVPEIEVVLLDRPDQPPLGAGEVAQGPMAAAIANAAFDALGVRLRELPFTPERVRAALSL